MQPVSEQIWKAKYRFQPPDGAGERSIEDSWARVAKAAAAAEKPSLRAKWEKRFLDAMTGFVFIPAGRILAGAGTRRDVTLFNCFVMGEIGDDMGSIFANVREAALTLQQGGGIGHDFSTIRPKGAPVHGVGADASGPVSFMDVWDAMCRTIMSAGARRGAMMATLRCDHPDIEAFIGAKADPARLRNFNVSVLATDAFMKAVQDDALWPLTFAGEVYRTVKARDLWHKIMRSAYDYAEPGVIFIDRVNALNCLSYCEDIKSTNPCVTAGAWIQTPNGARRVRDLLDRQVSARVNGCDYPSANGFFCTGVKPLLRVTTVEGYELELTPDHLVRRSNRQTRDAIETVWCKAAELSPGDKVVLNDHRASPEWPGPYNFEQGYLAGLLIGDGTIKSDKAILSVWLDPAPGSACGSVAVMQRAFECATTLKHRSDFTGWLKVEGRREYRMALAAIKALAEQLGWRPGQKAVTPQIEGASSNFYRGFLQGFFDCDGSVQGTQSKGVSVRLAQSDIDRLKAVQRMLLRLGIASKIYTERRLAGPRRMSDGKGGHAVYQTKANHELVISGSNILQFRNVIGFADGQKRQKLEIALAAFRRKLNRERFLARVLSIAPQPSQPVYDVQIPGLNAFDANGFYVHNCGEQPLPPYGACLLGSINLAASVERPFAKDAAIDPGALEKLAGVAVRFLDNIIDTSRYPLPAQEKEAKAKRRIGLGVTGLADALILCGRGYGAPEGRELASSWMSRITDAAYRASAALAEEKGAFPLFDPSEHLKAPFIAGLSEETQNAIRAKGLRNGLSISIAPTGTISLLADNVSSGVEPVFDFEYERRILAPDGTARTEAVQDRAYRLYRELHGDEPLPDAFVTARDLTPAQHLLMQAGLQRHVDASISKTVNCPEDIAFEDFESLYLDAYRLGLKGCTAYRPNRVTGAVLVASAKSGGQETSPALQPALALSAASRPDAVGPFAYPMARDSVLPGFTYKIKWPDSDHALYVTINDTMEDGARRPFEIFINSKNLEHYAWTVALTRMISAIFRRSGDVSFVVEELKAIFDPRGGAWMGGRYVPSLIAAIGDVIQQHFEHIGFADGSMTSPNPGIASSAVPENRDLLTHETRRPAASSFCTRCGSPSVIFQEGCLLCRNCGYSSCG